MQYSKMKIAVGLFVISLVITITTFLLFILNEKGTFDKRYNYHFYTRSANSFSVGMPLKFSGFNIGVIDNISLENDGNVHMTFSVSEKNRKWIADGTTLMIIKPLIGSAHIEVHSIVGNKPLKEESTLNILLSDDINDMISKLEPAVENIIKIINSVEVITTQLSQKDSDLLQTLHNINLLSEKLASSDSLLTTITGNKSSTQSVISSLNQTSKIMKNIKNISSDISQITSSLDQSIVNPTSSSIKEVEAIMKDIKLKLEAIDGTVQSVGSMKNDLSSLKEQIAVGLEKSTQLMDKVDALMQDKTQTGVVLP